MGKLATVDQCGSSLPKELILWIYYISSILPRVVKLQCASKL